MLELRLTKNKDDISAFCARSGLGGMNDALAYEAVCGGKIAGYCLFTLGSTLSLADAVCDAEFGAALCDGLVRAVLNYAALAGVTSAQFAESFNAEVYEALNEFGFKSKTICDIDIFLTTCKACGE